MERSTNSEDDEARAAIARLRLYVELMGCDGFALGEIKYDERFLSEYWKHTAYHPSRPDLAHLLEELDMRTDALASAETALKSVKWNREAAMEILERMTVAEARVRALETENAALKLRIETALAAAQPREGA